jgi:diacylglycerol kinase
MEQSAPGKSRGGLRRIWHAAQYSRDGLRDAWRHEAAFR